MTHLISEQARIADPLSQRQASNFSVIPEFPQWSLKYPFEGITIACFPVRKQVFAWTNKWCWSEEMKKEMSFVRQVNTDISLSQDWKVSRLILMLSALKDFFELILYLFSRCLFQCKSLSNWNRQLLKTWPTEQWHHELTANNELIKALYKELLGSYLMTIKLIPWNPTSWNTYKIHTKFIQNIQMFSSLLSPCLFPILLVCLPAWKNLNLTSSNIKVLNLA